MPNIIVLTTLASDTLGTAEQIYAEVFEFHRGLAEKYGLNQPPVVIPTVVKYRVIVSTASLRSGPGVDQARIGYAYAQDILTQIGTAPEWIQTERGWVQLKQLEAI